MTYLPFCWCFPSPSSSSSSSCCCCCCCCRCCCCQMHQEATIKQKPRRENTKTGSETETTSFLALSWWSLESARIYNVGILKGLFHSFASSTRNFGLKDPSLFLLTHLERIEILPLTNRHLLGVAPSTFTTGVLHPPKKNKNKTSVSSSGYTLRDNHIPQLSAALVLFPRSPHEIECNRKPPGVTENGNWHHEMEIFRNPKKLMVFVRLLPSLKLTARPWK